MFARASTLEEGLARALRALQAMEPFVFKNFVESIPGEKGAFIAQYVFDRVNQQLATGDIGLINISEVPRDLSVSDIINNGESVDGDVFNFVTSPGGRVNENREPAFDKRPFINPYDDSFRDPNVIRAFDPESPQPTSQQQARRVAGIGFAPPLTADTIFSSQPVTNPDGTISTQISVNPMFGTSEGNIVSFTIDAIFIAYEGELLDLADTFTNFKGSREVSAVLSFVSLLVGGNCSRAPLFTPGIYEFIKNLELQFCRNRDPIAFPTFRGLPKIGDVLGALKDAVVYVLKELLMAIISAIIEFICKTIGDAICKALGAVGNLLLGSPDGDPNNLSGLLSDAFCGDSGQPSNFTDADFSALSKAVGGLSEENGRALNGPVFAAYMRDLSSLSHSLKALTCVWGDKQRDGYNRLQLG